MSVNTDALLGEAWRDARLFAGSQNDTSVVEHVRSIEIVIKSLNVPYIYDRRIIMGEYTDGREGVLDEAGGEQHKGGAKRAETWRGWVK